MTKSRWITGASRVFLLALLCGGIATPARGAVVARSLQDAAGIHIVGASTVSAAGDVNGDGTPDLLVAEGFRDRNSAGRVSVVFGTSKRGEIDVDKPGQWGFVINGARAGDSAAIAAGASDVNGDGMNDVIVGAPDADKAYVVFGKETYEAVSLLHFDANVQGAAGYRVDGAGGLFGRAVAGLGDVNGDGLSDFAVGAPFKGATYVLFGKADSLPYDANLLHFGAREGDGFVVTTPAPDLDSGYSVAGLGDVNGDAIPDLAVGVADHEAWPAPCCRSWVVFGKRDDDVVRVRDLGRGGFKILDSAGVSAVGDVNADGRADVGLSGAVVFGSPATRTVDISDLGRRGWQLRGRFVVSAAGPGDVTGDGRDDVLVGDVGARFAGDDSGSAYLVPGKASTATVRLRRLRNGLRLDGERAGSRAGDTVVGPGDVNGDGIPDLAIGSPGTPATTRGDVYVVWGRRL